MLLAFSAAVCLILFALVGASLLRIERTVPHLVAIYLLAVTNIILVSRILGTFYALGDSGAWLLAHFLLLCIISVWWWFAGKPSLVPIQPHIRSYLRAGFKRENWLLITIVTVVTVAYLTIFLLIVISPPNNWDGMSYRLPRVMYWLQFETFYPHITTDMRITNFPQNAEIGTMWTIVLTGSDHFTGLVQWGSAIISALVIFDLTRLIGQPARHGIFAAVIWLSLPLVFLEARTIQNDLVVSAFFIISVYFLYEALKHDRHISLFLSGISIGLAIGTKSTIAFILPGYALAAIIIWLSAPRQLFRPLLMWAIYSIVGFVLFGAYSYAVNYVAFGDLVGGTEASRARSLNPGGISLDLLALNLPRYMYQLADFSGVPEPFGSQAYDFTRSTVTQLFSEQRWFVEDNFIERVPFRRNEDRSWFGVLGYLVMLPALIVTTFQGIKNKNPYMLGLVVMAMTFALLHSALQPWTAFKGRYYVLVSVVVAPLLFWVMYSSLSMRVLRYLVVVIAIASLGTLLFHNDFKPEPREFIINDYDRIDIFIRSRNIEEMLRTFEDVVPVDATVRVARQNITMWLYPYWGEARERILVPVPAGETTYRSLEEIANANVEFPFGAPPNATYPPSDYIIIDRRVLDQIQDTSGFERLSQIGEADYVYRRIIE